MERRSKLRGEHSDYVDLDQNTSDSILRHNLSYANDGAGYMLSTNADNDVLIREWVSGMR